MSFTMMNYDEVLEDVKEQKRYLLLGNGFSMAYNPKRFSFTSLLDNAVERELIRKTSPIYKVFTQFDTKDFEEVVKLLETSTKVLKTYGVLSKADEKKILAKEWFLKNLGKPYDNLALLGFLLRVVDGEKEKFFCSEAICESLGISESWRFDPNALYNLILCIY
jgi:hypothetical protein